MLSKKHKKLDEAYFEDLEDILIQADIGVNTVIKFVEKLRKRVKDENIIDVNDLREIIVDEMFIITAFLFKLFINCFVIINGAAKLNF